MSAVSAFLIVTLIDTFGVYYDALVEQYDSTRAAFGWIFSFRWIFMCLSDKQMYFFLICISGKGFHCIFLGVVYANSTLSVMTNRV